VFISKQVLAWLFVAGGGVVGWLMYLSADDRAEPAPVVAVAAKSPERAAAPEGLTLRLTIVTPDGETSQDVEVVADPVPHADPVHVAPAAAQGGDRPHGGGGGRPSSVTVNQDLMVLAHDGAIVYLGDDGSLTANTGDTAASGAVVIDSVDSTLETGQSTVTGGRAATGVVRTPTDAVVNEFAPHLGDRAVAISGYENHSVNVAGDDQIVTYDDSNVFVDRDGEIVSNTGDTDSSGLNALGVIRSFVRSGDSADAPPGEEPEEPEDPEEELAPVAALAAGGRAAQGSAAVTDDDGGTSADGHNPLVVGGDGYDDLGIRSSGNRNIVTYDDSNVVVGGTGGAMSQIGDADTGGAVVMSIIDSHVEAGNAY